MFNDLYTEVEKKLSKVSAKIPVFSKFPETKTIDKIPSIFFEMTDFEPVNDPMTGELDFETRWEAAVIFSSSLEKAQIYARNVAARIALAVHQENFVSNAGPARVLRCSDSDFDLKVSGFEVWAVEWAQTIRLGISDFKDSFEGLKNA